jgi:small subunit ribosomal protein S17
VSDYQTSRNRRKVREGIVTSDKMDKTIVVTISERVRHPLYGKILTRSKRLHVHDGGGEAHVGDRVKVMETRPMSKTKRWRLVEILERAK